MKGPCAKRRVVCRIVTPAGVEFLGENACENAQAVCPRAAGENYTKCRDVCQQAGHAEIEALKLAGEKACGAVAWLYGHYWVCEPCGRALLEAGVISVVIVRDKI